LELNIQQYQAVGNITSGYTVLLNHLRKT